MRLQRIKIENALGVRRIDVTLEAPVLFIAGPNGAGKSTIADCLRFAFLGDPSGRVALKKEYVELVHEGAKAGAVRVLTDKGDVHIGVPGGDRTDNLEDGVDLDALAYVLDAVRFTQADADERRTFLFALNRLELGDDAIVKRLLDRGCNAAKVDAIAPVLGGGFEAAHRQAAARATDAKGAWRGVTGENYGSKKAERWSAPQPTFTEAQAAELHALDAQIAVAEALLGQTQRDLGVAEHEEGQQATRARTYQHLKDAAAKLPVYADQVTIAEEDLAGFEAELVKAKQAAGQAPVPAPQRYECPCCKEALMLTPDGLRAYKHEPPKHDPKAAERARQLQAEIAGARSRLDLAQSRHRQAEQAATDLRAIPEPPTGKPAKSEALRESVERIQADISAMRQRKQALQGDQASTAQAEALTKKAEGHHRDALEWLEIADALAPDGIPGELLAQALGPINERLAQHALDTGWMQARIGPDMAVTANGRPYRRLSRSEKWRTDAMIAEAIAHLSGLRLLVLDEFDVLDLRGRAQALEWLDVLVSNSELESALVLATLKQRPTLAGVQVEWLEAGELVAALEAEAA